MLLQCRTKSTETVVDLTTTVCLPWAPTSGARAFSPPITSWYWSWKRTSDLLAAIVLLVICLPVIVVAALLVKLTSRGPAFYHQVRLGWKGKPYYIWKLRTMYQDCEKVSGAMWSQKGDPRVTPLGRIFRHLHIDEFPQLFNVLRGEMSLVGPRPERPEFVPQLEQAIPYYRDRMSVLPGITGLAQIQLPADTDLASVRRKLSCDLYYVQNLSLWLDARILLCTACKLFAIPFDLPRILLRVPCNRRQPTIRLIYDSLAVN